MNLLKSKVTLKNIAFVLAFTLIVNMFPMLAFNSTVADSNATSYQSSTQTDTLAEFVFSAAPTGSETSPSDGLKKDSTKLGLSGGRTFGGFTASTSTIYANGWDLADTTDKYWYINTSTNGYSNIGLSFGAFGSGSGPKNFVVEYATNATGPYTAAGTYALGSSLPTTDYSFTLPENAANQGNLYIRLRVTDQVSTSGGVVASGGTSRLCNVRLTGTAIDTGIDPVIATPDEGAVKDGTVVTLTTSSSAVYVTSASAVTASSAGTIYYVAGATSGSIDNPTVNSTPYTEPITINFGSGTTYKIKAINVTATGSSNVSEFVYTKSKLAIPTVSPEEGRISANTTVSFSLDVNDASIYYTTTTDGTEPVAPTVNSTKYTGPFEITPGTFISTIVIGDGYISSDLKTFKFESGSMPPIDTTEYNTYFGQMHAHSAASDGAGEVNEAFTYARDTAGLDYFALTDHSNSYDKAPSSDKAGTYNLDTYNSDNPTWQTIKSEAVASRTENFTGLSGYEMTWSGGPGHINTFFTNGFVSRNNSELNSKTNDAGLQAYYTLLKNTPGSISQFNHPGTTFGNFSNFGYIDDSIDSRISLLEVGNGEGAIGSGGYFPSYEQYTLALDKGWHVAPTNNQDNHKKGWGTSNDGRTVVKAVSNSEADIKDALNDMRVYATEVKDLTIDYKAAGYNMGTVLPICPEEITFEATLDNASASNTIKSVHLVTNGGIVVGKQTFGTNDANYSFTLTNPASGYYYLMATVDVNGLEAYAVTAPVWFGDSDKYGFTSLTTSDSVPVTDLAFNVTTKMFNSDSSPVTVTNLKYVDSYGKVIFDGTPSNNVIAAISGTTDGTFTNTVSYTATNPGDSYIDVYATVTNVKGSSKTLTNRIEFKVLDSDTTNYIGIDGSHYNEYVSGNYKDSMTNFTALASFSDVRVSQLNTSEELIAALNNDRFKTVILTAPTRRLTPTQIPEYKYYTEEELAAIASFARRGGTIIVGGWSDYYENYSYSPKEKDMQMSAVLNDVLEAVNSHIRVSDDGTYDDVSNGGQAQRLYLKNTHNPDNALATGVVAEQEYSDYGGASVYIVDDENNATTELGNVEPLIYGYPTTYSKDGDKDGFGLANATDEVPRYGTSEDAGKGTGQLLVAASETITHDNGVESLVVAGGSVFMSNFEVQATLDNYASLQYSNYTIAQNIINSVKTEKVISNIADVRNMEIGTKVNIDAIVTSEFYVGGSTNNKGFFDSIYVQDETGGINVFPVSSDVILGKPVQLTGVVSEYQGEKQLDVSTGSVDVVTGASVTYVEPTKMSTAKTMSSENTGLLVKTEGTVKSVVKDGSTVNQIVIDDGSGEATVYINTYITSGVDLSFIEVGKKISVIGFSSYGEIFGSEAPASRIRVRDRAEIKLVTSSTGNGGGGSSSSNNNSSNSNTINGSTLDSKPKVDANGNAKLEVSNNEVKSLVDNVKKSNGNHFVINLTPTTDAKGGEVTLSKDALKSVADESISIVIKQNKVEVRFDKTVLDSIVSQADANVTINFEKVTSTEVNAKQSAVIGNRPSYELTITSGDKEITNFGKSFVKVKVPYEAKATESANSIIINYVDEAGNKTVVVNSIYDKTTNTISFATNHFSLYTVDHNAVNFTDVNSSHWAYNVISESASKELVNGVGNDMFAPSESVTRAEFVALMANMAKLDEYTGANPYADVESGKWYYNSIGQAKNAGWLTAFNSQNFEPNKPITREEMASVLAAIIREEKIAVTMNYIDLSTVFNDFKNIDSTKVSDIELCYKLGLMSGMEDGSFSPKSDTTRAQAVSVQLRLLDLLNPVNR